MCGFLCFVSKTKETNIPDNKIGESAELLAHRGPDNYGYFSNDWFSMAFKRLSIIDLNRGDQPLSFCNNRYWIVFNGEVYNYLELKNSLKRSKLKTDSDTEVILALYHEIGYELINKLRGMFSFVIIDNHKKELFGARDPFGIKPLYYSETANYLLFASEQKALLPFTDTTINLKSLHHYLTFQYPPEPETMHTNIKKIPKGHYFCLKVSKSTQTEHGRLSQTNYYKPTLNPIQSKFDKTDSYCREIKHALQESIKLHMRSDVPVGAFLSSGIDSTSIVAFAKKINPDIKTFSIGFKEQAYNEAEYAQNTAEQLNVAHFTKLVTAEQVIQDLHNIIWFMDDPIADPAAIPLFYVSQEASKHVKVVLSGEGADELFGGYNIYREPLDLNLVSQLPVSIKSMLNKFSNLVPEIVKGKDFLFRGTQTIENRYYGNARIFREDEKKKIYKKYYPNLTHADITSQFYKEAVLLHDIEKMQYIDLNTWLPGDILVKADRMTMANSLELRVPFLDKGVFQVAKKIQTNLKITPSTTKYILRRAVQDEIPESIINRKKLGFPVPIRQWLRGRMYDWAKQIINESATDYLFNKKEILKLLNLHKKGYYDYSRKIWTILTFMIWHQMFIEKS